MKKGSILIVVMIMMIISSCTKKEKELTYKQYDLNGIRITESSTTPADSTFRINLKELYSINNYNENPDSCFMQASSVDMDESGNLYVLDRQLYKIFKYNKTGKLVKIFGGHGQGPGEFQNPGTINVRKDTLFVTDFEGFKINKFDIEGSYITSKIIEDMSHFSYTPSKFGKNYITFGSSKNIASDDGKVMRIMETTFFDSSFNFIKNLHIIEFEPPPADVEHDPSEKGIKAAASDINAYVYENSKTQYKINVYDISGNKVREIRKKYIRMKTPEEVNKKLSETGAKYGRKYKQEFRNSIYNLNADKYNRLWVTSLSNKQETGNNYDVFENDIFIKRVKLEIDEGYMPNFIGDKIVGVNYEENKIKIYEY